ncbi:unnamed protein product, partial [Ectocarpus fasciculatus]
RQAGGVCAGAGGGYGGGSERPVSGFQVGADAPPGFRRGWYGSAARVSRAALQGLRAMLRKTTIEKNGVVPKSWSSCCCQLVVWCFSWLRWVF